jgi:hypothetical protein
MHGLVATPSHSADRLSAWVLLQCSLCKSVAGWNEVLGLTQHVLLAMHMLLLHTPITLSTLMVFLRCLSPGSCHSSVPYHSPGSPMSWNLHNTHRMHAVSVQVVRHTTGQQHYDLLVQH